MYMRVDSIQRHAKSQQHAGSVAKEHALLQSGDIGCILSSETRKQISRNREAVVGALRSLYFRIFSPTQPFLVHSLTSAFFKASQTFTWQAMLITVVRELFKSFCTQVFSTMLSQLQESPYIALMADGTTAIAVTNYMPGI
jgi:hypothetical protein